MVKGLAYFIRLLFCACPHFEERLFLGWMNGLPMLLQVSSCAVTGANEVQNGNGVCTRL